MTFDPVNADPHAISAFDAEAYIEVGGDVMVFDSPGTVQVISEVLRYATELFPVDASSHEAAVRLSKEAERVEEAVMAVPDSDGDAQIGFPTDETHDRTDLLLFATHAYEIWLKLGPDSFDVLPGYEEQPQSDDPQTTERAWRVPTLRDAFHEVSDANRRARKHAAEELIVATISFRLNADEPFSIGARSINDGELR